MTHSFLDREDNLIFVMRHAFPEIDALLPIRFNLMNTIKFNQPVGRRSLSGNLGYTERVVRRECDILKDSGLIEYAADGMYLTHKGKEVLEVISDVFYQMNGIRTLENELASYLNIHRVIIASVGFQEESIALSEVGYEAARYLYEHLGDKKIIGLTGGSSIERVVDGYKPEWHEHPLREVTVVPARGGVGNKYGYQANTLAERLADKMGAGHMTLLTQDNLSAATIGELKNEPHIQRILAAIEKIDALIFGIGRADVMANRRVLDQAVIDDILSKEAVAESFGYYFNKNGEIVHEVSTIGIDLETYKSLSTVIAVASGVNKAEAIVAVSKLNPNLVLVTDEQTAKTIRRGMVL